MLAERLRNRREVMNLTLTMLAKLSGVSKPYISQIEHGKSKRPSYDILSKLAVPLRTSVDFLMGKGTPIEEQDCESCIYFQRSQNPKNPDIGLCRRYPPFASGKKYVIVNTEKWCGEWRAR